jgi:hypothetical protein
VLPSILPTWRSTTYADGVALLPPEGRTHGAIRIRDRRRPLRSAHRLVAAIVAEMKLPGLEVSPIERTTTCEGEYVALVTITGVIQTQPFQRSLAFLFGDDFYTQIDANTTTPTKFEFFRKATRELAYFYSLGLGELRRRRYYYQPPPDWKGLPRGLITEWYPAGFPDVLASIAVFPARPVVESPAGVLDRALHELNWAGFKKTAIDEAMPLMTRNRLSGLVWRAVGKYGDGPIHHEDIVALQDDRFFYVMRLESNAAQVAEHRAILGALVESVEPLPKSDPGTTIHQEKYLDHWAD